jgi:hypothetical protein
VSVAHQSALSVSMKALWKSVRFDIPKSKHALQSPNISHTERQQLSCRGLERGYYQRANSPDYTSDGIYHQAQASLAQVGSPTTVATVTLVRGSFCCSAIVKYVSINIAMHVVTPQYIAELLERLRKPTLTLRRVEDLFASTI